MRRMNELWRRMILSVCLCLLLVLRCQGQDDATTLPTGSDPDQDSTTQLPSVGSSRSPTDAPATDGSAVVTDSVVPHATQNNDLSDVIYVSVGTVQPESTYVDLKGAVFAQNPRSQQPVDSTLSPDEVQGIESSEEKPVKTTPTVLISLLLIGLSIAAALIGGYMWKNHHHTNAKGMKLADESCMPDEENQGNTLVSVAPLNAPEVQEKPSQNGESPEAVKDQPAPAATNGHSATKTADTEL